MKHQLQLILEGQGADACIRLLRSERDGANLRDHAEDCAVCGAIVDELFGGRPIPVDPEPFTDVTPRNGRGS